jgi:23S rRNA pseudouridine1911/1915/1917 synthase
MPDAEEPGFDILYEAGPCLVVAKPGGLLTQAPPTIDSLERRVKQFLKQRDNKPGRIYLGVPHRLDRPVSGALVLARHVRAARRLCEQFELRTVQKVYWALLEGRVDPPYGAWHDRMRKIPEQPQAEIVAADHPDGRSAALTYQVLAASELGSWVEIQLETGRMHQIRLQAAHRGHPVWGDQQYGSAQPFGPATNDPRARWIALHARRLAFRHPMTREHLTITAPLPACWSEIGWAAWREGESGFPE